MNYVNKYLRNLKPYNLASHDIWSADKVDREQMLKLDWNEASIPPSPQVARRIKALVDSGDFFNIYPSTCNEQLLDLLSAYLELPKENIQYFASSDSIHEYAAKLFISVGDPVLLVGPTYDNFRLTAEVCGGKLYYYNMDESFVFDENEFYRQMDLVKPSLVYICNPNNPTGTLHTVDFIEKTLKKYEYTLFLVDEAYAEFSSVSCKELVRKYENIIISRTMSKAFALANFRIGYMIASKDNIEYISNIRNPKNISTFAQEAAIGALSDLKYMYSFVREVNEAKRIFISELGKWSEQLKCVAGEGNFVLICMKQSGAKAELFQHLRANRIYVRDVSQTQYLKDYCLRVSIGTREQMSRVVMSIDSFFQGAELKEKEGLCNTEA